jgi:hypothetical protein
MSTLRARRKAMGDWVLTTTKLRKRDWVGDAVITIIAGLALVASVFLPWANVNGPGTVNYSFSKPAAINGAMATDFGLPVLVAGLAVVAVGLTMIVFGPNRFAVPLGLTSGVAALLVLSAIHEAAHGIMLFYDGGLGLAVAFVTALMLPVIGLASAMVGLVLNARARRERALAAAAEV